MNQGGRYSLLVGTGCSGSDAIVLVCKALTELWSEAHGVSVELKHIMSVESIPWKRDFIRDQWGVDYLFEDIRPLHKEYAFDHKPARSSSSSSRHMGSGLRMRQHLWP